MRRIEIDGENPGTDANQAEVLSRSAARTSLIPFPCRPAPRPVTAAGSDLPPPLDPAPFEPLGNAVAAVVMRLRGDFPRVSVLRVAGEDSDPEA
jgi:hypothetical protein